MGKKILIIGNSAKEYALAKYLSKDNEIYVAPGSQTVSEFATCVDIREDSISELLDFVLENSIDLTIPTSENSINSNITDLFISNGQQIFAPSSNASNMIFDKATVKKILYKLRVPTPKFGIFEKQNMVMDYIKNIKPPFVIKTNASRSAIVLTSTLMAKNIVLSLFLEKNQKVIIEDYIYGTPFSFYVISDGYKALPLGSAITYKHSLDGEGGQLTSGMGACVPNYKLSIDNEYFIIDNIVYPLLDYMQIGNNPYLGILGIDGILTEDGTLQILGFTPFLQDCDCDAILELLNVDLVNLMESCIVGSFSDEVDYISTKDLSAVSLVLMCKNNSNIENTIDGLDLLEDCKISFYNNVRKNRYLEYEVEKGAAIVLTNIASTASSAAKKVYDNVESINFKGMYYRKDICKRNNC